MSELLACMLRVLPCDFLNCDLGGRDELRTAHRDQLPTC
jgi:hypothetical protein